MKTRVRTETIWCPVKKRGVEVKFSVTGSLLNKRYAVLECPAMYDRGTDCDHRCVNLVGRNQAYTEWGPRPG